MISLQSTEDAGVSLCWVGAEPAWEAHEAAQRRRWSHSHREDPLSVCGETPYSQTRLSTIIVMSMPITTAIIIAAEKLTRATAMTASYTTPNAVIVTVLITSTTTLMTDSYDDH